MVTKLLEGSSPRVRDQRPGEAAQLLHLVLLAPLYVRFDGAGVHHACPVSYLGAV